MGVTVLIVSGGWRKSPGHLQCIIETFNDNSDYIVTASLLAQMVKTGKKLKFLHQPE